MVFVHLATFFLQNHIVQCVSLLATYFVSNDCDQYNQREMGFEKYIRLTVWSSDKWEYGPAGEIWTHKLWKWPNFGTLQWSRQLGLRFGNAPRQTFESFNFWWDIVLSCKARCSLENGPANLATFPDRTLKTVWWFCQMRSCCFI